MVGCGTKSCSFFPSNTSAQYLKAKQMDILRKLFAFCGEGEFFLEHGGGGFEAIGGEEFEDFCEEVDDPFVFFVEVDEALVEEEEEVA